MSPEDLKAAWAAAQSILAGRGGPWAGAQLAAQDSGNRAQVDASEVKVPAGALNLLHRIDVPEGF
jgi:hypothetical protein